MKKMLLIVLFISILSNFLFGTETATPETIMIHIYDNFDAMNSMNATIEFSSMEIERLKGIEKKSAKSHQSRKKQKTDVFYPNNLFNVKALLMNCKMSIKIKDDRIKRGIEEIIAKNRDQNAQFPQIRIFIKENKVMDIRFYNSIGKKYYEIKVNKYEKINNVNMPVNITERIITLKNTITNTIIYKNVIINNNI